MRHHVKTIELPGRVTLSYAEQGDPAGVPVVLLHGITDSWRSYEPVLPYLPSSMRMLALSQRGHGDSERPATGYRTRDFAGDVTAFMDALGIERAVIVGHSMGSSNALRFVLDHPGRTLGLVLLGAFARYGDKPELVEFCRRDVAALTDPVDAEFAREFQLSTLVQSVPPEFFDTVMDECLKVPAQVWRAGFDGLLEDDFADELHRITAPSLIVWGRHDAFCPRSDQHKLLGAIADSRLVTYDDSAHALHWEEPKRFATDLARFVHTLTTRGTMLAQTA